MNHSYAFKKVNQSIRLDLAKLRAKGYYGDGFWSAGKALTRTGGEGERELGDDEMPNYTCGGAMKRSRKRKPRAPGAAPRRAPGAANVGLHTGRQTAIPRKAGGRVNRADAFGGEGKVLNAAPEMSTFRFVFSTVEARAAAAEARLQASKIDTKPKATSSPPQNKSKGKADVINLCSSDEEGGENQDDDELWENEDPPMLEYDDDEKSWMMEDMKNWGDDIVIVESVGGSATMSGSTKGKEKSSGSTSNASKRAMEVSDNDEPPKKVVKPKPKEKIAVKAVGSKSAPTPAPAPAPPDANRRWRATSEERETASKVEAAKVKRSPQKFFSSGSASEKNHVALVDARKRTYIRSSPAKKGLSSPNSEAKKDKSNKDSGKKLIDDSSDSEGETRPSLSNAKRPSSSTSVSPAKRLATITIGDGFSSEDDIVALPFNYLDATPTERTEFMNGLNRHIAKDEERTKARAAKRVANGGNAVASGSGE
ncbi:hypothetical protein P7C70_g7752, partial [Phenoliferia sp. Uapishka_3]